MKLVDVRLATLSEMGAVKQLWSKSFGDKDPYLSWYFDNVSSAGNTVVCTHEGQVSASLQLIDYDVNIGGSIYKACYIAGVCTDEKFRNKGYGSKIMKFAEEEAARRNKDFVFLCPAIEGFYEKLGYNYWGSLYENTVLPDEAAKQGCRKADKSDIDYILQVYNDFVQNHSGYTIRTRTDFMRIMKAHELFGGGIYLTEEGGYFICEKSEQRAHINEMICPIDEVTGFIDYGKIIVRSKYDFGGGENKPKYLYKICSDMDENVFKEKGQYINILY
ncbi:MAG: GNAT family N-acetyltransferase [Clostridia bacterium]|nr:GNAT family N-acetyltransferase [Clostridia bacterium]